MQELTVKQKNYCHYFVETGNQSQAYRMAGYTCNSENTAKVEACRLMKKPAIQAYIQELMEQKDNEKIASQDEVLEFLTKTMRDTNCPVAQRIRSAELLGKRYATFIDKVQQENSGEVNILIIDEEE